MFIMIIIFKVISLFDYKVHNRKTKCVKLLKLCYRRLALEQAVNLTNVLNTAQRIQSVH